MKMRLFAVIFVALATMQGCTYSLIYTFDKEGVGTAVTKTQITPGVYNTASVDLAWVWGETKENISIEQTWAGVKLGTKLYRILRMTNKEMWWENPSNKTKRIEFSRID